MSLARYGDPDIVAVGASAGGVDAIARLLAQLPASLPATVFVVLHRPAERVSHLREILARRSRLKVVVPTGGESLEPGTCYVGDPALHLTLGPDLTVQLLYDGFYRSHNIDALFCTLALHAGHRTIGVVLSGMLKDGTLGLKAIREAGGVTMVQSPEDAAFPEMPYNAIRDAGPIDTIGSVDALALEICRLTGASAVPQGRSEARSQGS